MNAWAVARFIAMRRVEVMQERIEADGFPGKLTALLC